LDNVQAVSQVSRLIEKPEWSKDISLNAKDHAYIELNVYKRAHHIVIWLQIVVESGLEVPAPALDMASG